MNAKTEQGIQAQVHTFDSVEEKCRLSGFWTVQQTEVMNQFKLSIADMQKGGKFLARIDVNWWPEHMPILT